MDKSCKYGSILVGLVAAAVVAVTAIEAGPSFFETTIKYIFKNGITVSGGAVDFSGASSVTGDLTVFEGENGETIANSTDDFFIFTREDAGIVTLSCADTDATAGCTYDAGGASPIVVGSADVTSVTVTTDSTGNAEVVLPSASIGAAELGGATLRYSYCGQNAENGTIYVGGPVLTAVEPTLADATCDGFDNATEGTADIVLSAGLALTPKYMRCILNGTLGAAETVVFQLRDDTANVTGVTCSLAVGETVCEVLTPTASAIAAGSATAVSVVQSSDNSDDDSKCVVLYQVQ